MKTEEILTIHTLTEAEQVEWLARNDILQFITVRDDPTKSRWESLPELAFRLRDEADKFAVENAMDVVARHVTDNDENHHFSPGRWFVFYAKVTHWIEVYLLAMAKEGR